MRVEAQIVIDFGEICNIFDVRGKVVAGGSSCVVRLDLLPEHHYQVEFLLAEADVVGRLARRHSQA